MLQKEVTIKDKTRLQKNRIIVKFWFKRILKATSPEQITQTHPMLMFLIVTPPVLLRLM